MSENVRPNYKNRKKKKVHVADKKRFTLAILLTLTIGVSSIYGVTQGLSNAYNGIKNMISYSNEVYSYRDLVMKNCHVTNDYQHYFINTYNLAQDVKKLEVNSKDDVYHHFISIASNIDFNRTANFEDFLNSFDLDAMAAISELYPTEQEFRDFLFKYNLLNEDGSINFDEWKKYDKKVYTFEKELNEEFHVDMEEGKSL